MVSILYKKHEKKVQIVAFSEQEERLWDMKVKRAEEQAKRSGRMLYSLQRKVQELNRHINKKTFEIKDWKKVLSYSHRALHC